MAGLELLKVKGIVKLAVLQYWTWTIVLISKGDIKGYEQSISES